MNARTFVRNDLISDIIRCAVEVHRELGPGLLESTYQWCLGYEFERSNITFKSECLLPVIYKGREFDCGYRIDMLVCDQVILELKSVELMPIHEAQLLTYMKLANIQQGFLINFNVQLLKNGIKSLVL